MTTVTVTETDLLGGRVRCHQPAHGYRAAIDPVLLAAAVPAMPGDRVLDLGAGVGTAGLCLAARVRGIKVAGLEVQPQLTALAQRSVEASGLSDSVRVVTGDLLDRPLEIAAESFDHVIACPPYVETGKGNPPPDPIKAIAVCEGDAKLVDWLEYSLAMAKPGGQITVIHRADRLTELLACMAAGAGDIAVYPLWPRCGEPAKRLIVLARKGSGGPLTMLPGLVLHELDGRFTGPAEAVLRDATSLPSLDVLLKAP